eukprot:8877638-Pyramimonas_sp.AAC.1
MQFDACCLLDDLFPTFPATGARDRHDQFRLGNVHPHAPIRDSILNETQEIRDLLEIEGNDETD